MEMYQKNKFDEQQFGKYFFYGLENRHILLEGIIYYTNYDLNLIHLNIQDERLIQNKFTKLIQKSSRNYEQIYKFINIIEEQPERYDIKISKREKIEIQNTIIEKLRQLYREGMLIDRSKRFTNSKKRGIFFNDKFSSKYANYVIGDKNNREIWTQEVYNVILQLNYLEENEPIEYYEKWLQAKLSRMKNKPQNSKKEIEQVEKAYQMFQERKSKANLKDNKLEDIEKEL